MPAHRRHLVSDLAFYFGILPLSIVLLAMYGVAFLAYRSSQRAMSPIITLAERLEQLDFDRVGALQLDLSDFRAGDSEVGAMVTALDHFTNRLNRALERERHFTSDASHDGKGRYCPVDCAVDEIFEIAVRRHRFEAGANGLGRMAGLQGIGRHPEG